VNESDFHEAAEVLGRFLKPCKDAAGFFEPPNETLHNVPPAVCAAVELHGALVSIFIFLGRNDRLDAQVEQIGVDPIGTISLVTTEFQRPSHGIAFPILELRVHAFQESIENGGVVNLAWGEVKVQRMSHAIAKNVDFCRKTPARTA